MNDSGAHYGSAVLEGIQGVAGGLVGLRHVESLLVENSEKRQLAVEVEAVGYFSAPRP